MSSLYAVAEPTLDHLVAAARTRMKLVYRPGTWANYIAYFTLYIQFCIFYGQNHFRPDVDSISAYTEMLISSNMAPGTVKNHLSALKALFSMWNIDVKFMESYWWKCNFQSIDRSCKPCQVNKPAMSLDDLYTLVRHCLSDITLLTLRVALCFGYLGYLRVSNLAPLSANAFDSSRHTTQADVRKHANGLIINLKWTKTRQASTNICTVPLPRLKNSILCPVKAWEDYQRHIGRFGLPPDAPLLIFTGRSTPTTVTIPLLRSLLRRALLDTGLDTKDYTPHSWRRGGAVFSHVAGVPIDHIKRHGTWTSSAVETYLQSAPQLNSPVIAAFQQHIQDGERQ